MKPADASPAAGPIIPARIVSQTLRLPEDPVAQRWPLWLLITSMGVALFSCPALGFLALVTRQASGLPWVLLGFVPGAAVGLAIPLVRRYRILHPAPTPVPREEILVALDRLRVYTRQQGWDDTGERVSEAWLTAQGCYLGTGELSPWTAFYGFRIESLDFLVHRVALRRRLTGRQRTLAVLMPLLLFSFLGLGPLIELGTAFEIFRHHGMRTDLLAATIAGSMLLVSLVCLVAVYLREPNRPGSREKELVVAVDGECATRADLEQFLHRYLPRRR